jgi:hypothetical protein
MSTDSSVVAVYRTHGSPMERKPVVWFLQPQVIFSFGVDTELHANGIAALVQTTFEAVPATNLSSPFVLLLRGDFTAAVLWHSLTGSDRKHFLRIAKGRLPKTKLCVLSRDGELLAAQLPHSRRVYS